MIKIKIKKNKKDIISEVLITGHANYAGYGKDIVCAAVSSIALTTCNAILSLEDSIYAKEESGKLEIKILNDTDINQKLLDNMIVMFKELTNQYPKNIEIRNEE